MNSKIPKQLGTEYLNLLRILKQSTTESAQSLITSLKNDESYDNGVLDQILQLSQTVTTSDVKIAGYKTKKSLGSGSGGMVFLAEQGKMGNRPVAIKIPIYENLIGRTLEEEGKLLTRLSHPFITTLYKFGYATINKIRRFYLILEYIQDPMHLFEFCDTKPDLEKLRIFLEVCEGVSHAHKQGIIHCDLKSLNILVGADHHPKILDFGLARTLKNGEYNGEILGTPDFMSPEAARGDTIDVRTDIYSLGVILYRIFEHSFPYQITSRSLSTLADEIADIKIARPERIYYKIFPIIQRCLEKEPQNRFANITELMNSLIEVRESGSLSNPINRYATPHSPTNNPLKNTNKITSFRSDLINQTRRCAEREIICRIGNLAERFGASSAWLFVFQNSGKLQLHPHLSHNTPDNTKLEEFAVCDATTPRNRRSVVGYVANTRLPYVIPDINAGQDQFYYCSVKETRSEIAIPLLTRGTNGTTRLIGVLNLESIDPDTFLPPHVGALMSESHPLIPQLMLYLKAEEVKSSQEEYIWHPELFKWDLRNVLNDFTTVAADWLASLISEVSPNSETSNLIPSCTIWHCNSEPENLFVLSTSRFDYEYLSKFTLEQNSFTGSIRAIADCDVVFINDIDLAPQFLRTEKAGRMGMNCIFSTRIDCQKTEKTSEFRGVLNIYFFRIDDTLKANPEFRNKIGSAVAYLSNEISRLIHGCLSAASETISAFLLSEISANAISGVNDKHVIREFIQNIINCSGCSLFTVSSPNREKIQKDRNIGAELQCISTSGLVDEAGIYVNPREATYSLESEGDRGLTTTICKNGGRTIRLCSTEPISKIESVDRRVPIRNKYREKTFSTHFEHRPFLGVPVRSSTNKVTVHGAIRAVRSSELPPFTVFDQHLLELLAIVLEPYFHRWKSELIEEDSRRLFSLGARYPFLSTFIKSGRNDSILNAAERLMSPLPSMSGWNFRQVDAVIEDLVYALEKFGAFMGSIRLMTTSRSNIRIFAAYSRDSKNPLGTFEHSKKSLEMESLGMKAISERSILSSASDDLLLKVFSESSKAGRSLCIPIQVFSEMSSGDFFTRCVLSIDFVTTSVLDPDVVTLCYLATSKLTFLSKSNLDTCLRLDYSGGWRDALQRFVTFLVPRFDMHACEIYDTEHNFLVAKSGSTPSDQVEVRLRSLRNRIEIDGLEVGRYSQSSGGLLLSLRFGSLLSKFVVRCVFDPDNLSTQLRSVVCGIDTLWQAFVSSQSGLNKTALFDVNFTRRDMGPYDVWEGSISTRARIRDI